MAKTTSIKVLAIQQFNVAFSQLYVNTLSDHLRTSHLHINKPHKHDFYATMIFTKGSGIHEIDFRSYDVRPGSIFLLMPGQTHHWELSADADGIIFFHTQEYYETHYINQPLRDFPFFSSAQNIPVLRFNGQLMHDFELLFKKVLEVNENIGVKKTPLLLSIISQIYIELQRSMDPDANADTIRPHNYQNQFRRFETLVEQHYRTERSAAQYASWMNMSAKHLNRIAQAVLNKSTTEVITDRVVLEAKRMLIYAHNNFNETARQLGFDDYAHFSKIFKKKTGMTPTYFSAQYI
ncbi:MAG TPA: helix-turn-helix transcriptional regulator [Flavobacterium sp.]|nr:helix-turn-helix transcriptional regulator [Flavobacterium sp.]